MDSNRVAGLRLAMIRGFVLERRDVVEAAVKPLLRGSGRSQRQDLPRRAVLTGTYGRATHDRCCTRAALLAARRLVAAVGPETNGSGLGATCTTPLENRFTEGREASRCNMTPQSQDPKR